MLTTPLALPTTHDFLALNIAVSQLPQKLTHSSETDIYAELAEKGAEKVQELQRFCGAALLTKTELGNLISRQTAALRSTAATLADERELECSLSEATLLTSSEVFFKAAFWFASFQEHLEEEFSDIDATDQAGAVSQWLAQLETSIYAIIESNSAHASSLKAQARIQIEDYRVGLDSLPERFSADACVPLMAFVVSSLSKELDAVVHGMVSKVLVEIVDKIHDHFLLLLREHELSQEELPALQEWKP